MLNMVTAWLALKQFVASNLFSRPCKSSVTRMNARFLG